MVDELASQDIVVSYPVFETLFGRATLRGRAALEGLVARFCEKWQSPHFEFHEAIVDGNRVVLVWSFGAREAGAAPGVGDHSWGGITLLRFDEGGKIAVEIGEESEPGPMAWLRMSSVE